MDWTQLVAELSEFAETTRRDGRYWWSFTERGDLHEAKRGYDNIVEAHEADTYRRQRELARHISAKRIATSQSLLPPVLCRGGEAAGGDLRFSLAVTADLFLLFYAAVMALSVRGAIK